MNFLHYYVETYRRRQQTPRVTRLRSGPTLTSLYCAPFVADSGQLLLRGVGVVRASEVAIAVLWLAMDGI